MAQEIGNGFETDPALHQMRGQSAPQRMGSRSSQPNTRLRQCSAGHLTNGWRGKFLARADSAKNPAGVRSELPALQILRQSLAHVLGQRQLALAPSFARAQDDHPSAPLDLLQVQPSDFCRSEPQAAQAQNHSVVA